MEHMVQCVMTLGMMMMLKLFVDRQDILVVSQYILIRVIPCHLIHI